VSYTLGILALDNRAFDRLTPEDQIIVTEVLTATYAKIDAINRLDNDEAIDALIANGLKVVEANPDAIPYWWSVADKINAQMWSKQSVDKELLGEFMSALAEFRAADKAVAAVGE
jgi:TRAP-type C4-dicarboxylate transport system substrate-binding protein